MTDPILDPHLPADANHFLARVTRPDGTTFLLRIPNEHFDRVVALASGEFGDKTIAIGPRRWKE